MRLEVAEVRPGDTVIISTDDRLTLAERDELKERAQALFPDNRIVVLTAGITFQVIRAVS
jgi:hypothetical protein